MMYNIVSVSLRTGYLLIISFVQSRYAKTYRYYGETKTTSEIGVNSHGYPEMLSKILCVGTIASNSLRHILIVSHCS